MTPEQILILILGIITVDYLLDQYVDYLNLKASRSDIPDEVAEFYDREKYEKSITYHKVLARFSFLTSLFSFLLSFGLLSFGGFEFFDQLVSPYFTNEIFLALGYFALLFVLSDLINIPFQWYSTFIIEERFGFNKTTPRLFFVDKIKGYLLGGIFGALLLGTLLYLILTIGEGFWIYFWLVIAAFMLLANMFYTSLILPLFNKLTPLEDGDLKTAIEDYSNKVDFPLDNVFVIDGSKRSNKANAFFSGLGKRKKIVLYDTLINNHTIEELVAVLAHEVGHFKKKHIVSGYITSLIQTGLMLFIMSRLIFSESVSMALGAMELKIHLNLIAFSILYSPVSKIAGILGNILSRKNEFEADAYAADTYNKTALGTALKKLSVDSLSNLFPHSLYVFLKYSHPPLMERLRALGKV
ncbi:MAG: M48 family metallopeptidase [Bacteroidota bacterium]